MSNIWRQSPSGRFTSENLATNTIVQDFWELSTILLIVASVAHVQESDNIILVQNTVLSVNESVHSQIIDSPSLVQNYNLIIQGSEHNQTTDNTVLIQDYNITIQESNHTHTVENVILKIPILLDIQDATHDHFVNNVILTGSISVDSSIHNQYVNVLDLIQNYNLMVQNIEHGGGGGGGLKYWSGSQWIETSIKIYT